MAKTDQRPYEIMRLDIEFADNGIILRNPELKDEVLLALNGPAIHKPEGCYGLKIDHSNEHLAIGKKLYDWLTEVAIVEHAGYWVTTGAQLHIKATLNGRKM